MESKQSIAVFGGTRGVGKQFVLQALSQGHTVKLLARNPQNLDGELNQVKSNLTVVQGSVLDYQPTLETVQGSQVVINCLGPSKGGDPDVSSKGTNQIIKAMKESSVKRIITCSSLGVGDSYDKCGKVTKFVIWTIISKAIKDKNIMEEALKNSGLDSIIIRPGRLVDKAPTGNWWVDYNVSGGQVSRADVATWMLQQLTSNAFLGKAPSMVEK